MKIDIRDPSVDPNHLFYDFMLWMRNEGWHYTYRVNSQIHSWDLRSKIALWSGWSGLSDKDREIDALLYCWVSLGFLEAFGFDGAITPWVYVFKKETG